VERYATRDRNDIEVLSYVTCLGLLDANSVGRLAFVDAGTPVIVPVNYALDGTAIVFRSFSGGKLDAAERHRPVAFEIDHLDHFSRTGWSVVVTGVAEVVDDPDTVRRLERAQVDSWALADTAEASWVRLRTDDVSGRRVAPTATDPGDTT
jgi:nitroimidazol reductase NimA-like FMN-containing flavoprotein (pyridoxamine 5'-phosphate oxidase superfamily)